MRSNSPKVILAALISITFAYSFLNFFLNLGTESFYYDEVVYSLSGLEYLQGDFSRNWEHPFLGKYLIGLSLHLFGKSDFSARLPSALFGFLTGVVIYLFAREATNHWCGLIAVCLWSTSPIVLWVSRRAILDAPFVFFFALSWYLSWRFLQTKSTSHALLAGIALGLATATKLIGLILIPILFLYPMFPGIRDKSLTRMGEDPPTMGEGPDGRRSLTEPSSPFDKLRTPSRSGDPSMSSGQARRQSKGKGLLGSAMLGKLALAFLVAALIFLLSYAPVLDRLSPIFRVMNKHWQWEQRVGHREVVNNVIYDKQPWWTYLYWYWRGYPPYLLNYTPGVLILLGLAMGFALLRGKDIDAFLLISFILPFSYLSFYLSFKMFRYAHILEPPLAMLAASFVAAVSSFIASIREKGNGGLAGSLRYVSAIAIVALVAMLFGAMVHSTGNILAERENRYKAVARYLSPKLTGEETVFVWGYTNVMSWYLGEDVRIVGGFHSAAFIGDYLEADHIVVDPLMVSKWPDDPLAAYLEDNQAAYTKEAVGGFELYARRSGDS